MKQEVTQSCVFIIIIIYRQWMLPVAAAAMHQRAAMHQTLNLLPQSLVVFAVGHGSLVILNRILSDA
jgi:hypothetical protein